MKRASSNARCWRSRSIPSWSHNVCKRWSGELGKALRATNILTEAALSFLGVGVPLLTPSWGNIIEQGYQTIVTAPWLTIAPGLAIMITVVSLNVLGDALRDALDPHARLRIRN